MVNKIVVLDGGCSDPSSHGWADFESLGNFEVYRSSPPSTVPERLKNADIALTNKVKLTAALLKQLPRLRYIGVLATGVNCVDLEAARRQGIAVSNVPGYSGESVAQMVFAHILHVCRRVAEHSQAVKDGKWAACGDFCFTDYAQTELCSLTMGIVGMGDIGHRVARIAQAFGMNVLACNSAGTHEERDGISFVPFEQLLKRSDIVSLHCPLTDATQKLVNARSLALMKNNAVLVNTARGGLIDEAALFDVLKHKRIAAVCLDVLTQEPPTADNPLFELENCFITPHIAWATDRAGARLLRIAADNLRAFLEGRKQNVVND